MALSYPNNPLLLGNATFNPYISPQPYNPVPQIQTPAPVMPIPQGPHMEIQSVNGKESAYAYPMGPNSSAILADLTKSKIWVVTTDSSGYKAVKGFKVIEDDDEDISSAPVVKTESDQITELTERLNKLEERMNSYGQSNSKSAWQNKSDNANIRTTDQSSQGSKGSYVDSKSNVSK